MQRIALSHKSIEKVSARNTPSQTKPPSTSHSLAGSTKREMSTRPESTNIDLVNVEKPHNSSEPTKRRQARSNNTNKDRYVGNSQEQRKFKNVHSTLADLRQVKTTESEQDLEKENTTKLPELVHASADLSKIQPQKMRSQDMRTKLLQNKKLHCLKQTSLRRTESVRQEEQARLMAIINQRQRIASFLKPNDPPPSLSASMLTKAQKRMLGGRCALEEKKPGFVYGAQNLAKEIDKRALAKKYNVEPDGPQLYSDHSVDNLLEGGEPQQQPQQKKPAYTNDEMNEFKLKRFGRE